MTGLGCLALYQDEQDNAFAEIQHIIRPGCDLRHNVSSITIRITFRNRTSKSLLAGTEQDNPKFGFGPRACIGRKFAQIESTLFLCPLRDWKLNVVLKDGETEMEYEERVLGNAGLLGTAFGLGPVPIKLSRRR
ncbi:hypothetical protein DFH09DRAFT_1274382 [Mycena vulgaris]|nr:hypothetical protein DFH09DRAFT_1274382 [Mycena vulgaris]